MDHTNVDLDPLTFSDRIARTICINLEQTTTFRTVFFKIGSAVRYEALITKFGQNDDQELGRFIKIALFLRITHVCPFSGYLNRSKNTMLVLTKVFIRKSRLQICSPLYSSSFLVKLNGRRTAANDEPPRSQILLPANDKYDKLLFHRNAWNERIIKLTPALKHFWNDFDFLAGRTHICQYACAIVVYQIAVEIE
ncbi:unnamed protein product [Nesidiocoris tenuis]|uniref:Uncharacterized protein n=1 Tax=Nesidiocoris tenuis TaxID=355587 RepID=A0A6H5HK91_9HEMI|nr:unnamed protein product [Nesidiocoris tenuis]